MLDIWSGIISALVVFTFAIVSPGPNFVMVVSQSVGRSRTTGRWTAFGVAVGSATYGAAGLLGMMVILESFGNVVFYLKIVGGLYLIFMGIKQLLNRNDMFAVDEQNTAQNISAKKAFLIGLLTNLSNPKAMAFYLSIFTLVISPDFPLWSKLLLWGCMFLISWGWYSLVALFITVPAFKQSLSRSGRFLSIGLGGLLVFFGVKLLK